MSKKGRKSLSSKAWSSLVGKFALLGGACLLFYLVGYGFGLVPQPLKDLVNWIADNATLLAFAFCFTVGSYVFLRVYTHKSKSDYGGES
jgi:hypothetical protein